MDNAQKAIMLGVGLFITIIVIAAVMAITGIGQDLLNQGQSQLSGLSGQLAPQIQSQYDQQTMSGTQVKSAINKYYNDSSIAVYVVTGKSELTNTFLTEANKGGVAGYYRASAAKTNAATVTVNGVSASTATGIGKNRALTGVSLATCDGIIAEAPADTMSTINTAVNSTSQFKSALITNDDTGAIVGVVFVRYQ